MIPTATSEDEDEERDEAERARVRVVDASEEMAALMRGPEAVLRFDVGAVFIFTVSKF